MNMPKDSSDSHSAGTSASNSAGTAIGQSNQARNHQAGRDEAPSTMHEQAATEEPEMAIEPDLPSDGRDLVGEAMIRDLPQRRELSEPPSQPDTLKMST